VLLGEALQHRDGDRVACGAGGLEGEASIVRTKMGASLREVTLCERTKEASNVGVQ